MPKSLVEASYGRRRRPTTAAIRRQQFQLHILNAHICVGQTRVVIESVVLPAGDTGTEQETAVPLLEVLLPANGPSTTSSQRSRRSFRRTVCVLLQRAHECAKQGKLIVCLC